MKHLVSSNNVNEINRALLRIQESIESTSSVSTQTSKVTSGVTSAQYTNIGSTYSIPGWVVSMSTPFAVLNTSGTELALNANGYASITIIS